MLLMGTALNVLDTWLPIVGQLRARGKTANLLIPYSHIIRRSSPDDVLISLGNTYFENVFVQHRGEILKLHSLEHAYACFNTDFVGSSARWRTWQVVQVARRASPPRRFRTNISEILDAIRGEALLSDWSNYRGSAEFHDQVIREAENRNFSIFSIDHSTVPTVGEPTKQVPAGWTHFSNLRDHNAMTSHSSRRMVGAGIPRHDPQWISKVIDKSAKQHPNLPDRYALLLSHGDMRIFRSVMIPGAKQ